MSLRLARCLPGLLGAPPARLVAVLTVLASLPASLHDQSELVLISHVDIYLHSVTLSGLQWPSASNT